MYLWLVVRRTPVSDECPGAEPEGGFGTEYVYRCMVTNDPDSIERGIICATTGVARASVTLIARTTTSARRTCLSPL